MSIDLPALIASGESQTVEFKERVTTPEILARLISAFANADGGTILVGIKEPNVVVGIQSEQFERAYQRAIQRITGDVKSEFKIANIDNKSVGVITIQKSSMLVGSSEGFFLRIGESVKVMAAQQLSQKASQYQDHSKVIETLSNTVSKQTEEIGKLRESFEKSNSWQRKVLYAAIGAVVSGFGKAIFSVLVG